MSGPRARAMQITLQGIREINLAFCPFDRYAGTWEVRYVKLPRYNG